jgi:hypothetical protein
MFAKLLATCQNLLSFHPKPNKDEHRALVTKRPSISEPFSPQIFVSSPTYTENDDLFSTQLRACRDQTWWDVPQTHVCRSSVQSEDDDAIGEEPQKRSISIREIRERMNSEQDSLKSRRSSEIVYEPGLKLLNGLRGDWRDMEMFT